MVDTPAKLLSQPQKRRQKTDNTLTIIALEIKTTLTNEAIGPDVVLPHPLSERGLKLKNALNRYYLNANGVSVPLEERFFLYVKKLFFTA